MRRKAKGVEGSRKEKLSVAVGHDFLGQFGEDEGETNRPKKPKAVEVRQQLWKGREGVRTPPPQERVSEWMDGGALVQRPSFSSSYKKEANLLSFLPGKVFV